MKMENRMCMNEKCKLHSEWGTTYDRITDYWKEPGVKSYSGGECHGCGERTISRGELTTLKIRSGKGGLMAAISKPWGPDGEDAPPQLNPFRKKNRDIVFVTGEKGAEQFKAAFEGHEEDMETEVISTKGLYETIKDAPVNFPIRPLPTAEDLQAAILKNRDRRGVRFQKPVNKKGSNYTPKKKKRK